MEKYEISIDHLIDRLVQCSKEAFDDITCSTNWEIERGDIGPSEAYGEAIRGAIETFVYGYAEELKQKGEINV